MPSYNLSSSINYAILTDQTGSAVFDTGGPSGNYGSNENFYVMIAPAYATGTLTLNLTSFRSENGFDYLRIYSDIPPTSSFSYNATSVGGYLIGVFTGPSVTVPQTVTSSTGKAYIRWNSDGSVEDTGFALQWTGSGFYTVNSSSGVTTNKYALTIPKGAVSGSVLGFNNGVFTGSSILTADKDILFGAWLKADKGNRDATKRGIFGLGNTNGSGITIAKEASGAGDFSFYYRDNNGTFITSFSDIMMGGNTGAEPIAIYIPQWHYYGVALRKTSTTGAIAYAYRDGYLFATSSITYTASWGAVSSSAATLLVGAFRTSNTIQTSNTWSGSVDDMFMATVTTGAGGTAFNNFYSSIYNSGNWADPNTVITGAFNTSSYSPRVLFNWRFEETGSVLNTLDYGFYGIHSASTTSSAGGTLSLTPTSSGISYTPYSSLAYTVAANSGVPSLTSASYGTGEASGSLFVYVDRLSGSAGALSVDYSTVNGTAVSGTNYTKTTGSFSWADGITTRQSASIPILFDGVQTADKVFYFTLSNLSVGSFASYPSAISSSTITVVDQEQGTFSIESSSYAVIEGNSTTIKVNRYSGSFGAVNVNITSSNGTALSATDYNAISQTLAFANGETSKTLTATTIDNGTDVIPPPLYFTVGINTITPEYLPLAKVFTGTNPYTTVYITDNETGSVRFTNSSLTGAIGSTITIPVERYAGSDFAATASVTRIGGTAVAGIDYTEIFSYNVSWADQESGVKNISLQTLNTDVWRGNKTLTLELTSLTNLNIGSIMTASILFDAGVITESAPSLPSVSPDYTINSFTNASSQYTRRVEQVPLRFGIRGPASIRGSAYKVTKE